MNQIVDYQKLMPFKANDIYLEDKTKQVKAVCSNNDIAQLLANCVNVYLSASNENDRIKLYEDFIQSAYHLNVAISKANIPVVNLQTIFLEKAYSVFKAQLNAILQETKIKIDGKEQTKIADCIR